jgi:L-rhamnose isomerase
MGSIEHLRKGTDVNLTQLETDMTAVRPGSSVASIALPDYVEHQEGVSRVGALSAEAVVRDYEAAAREIEAMGAELIDAAKRCEAMTAEVHSAIAYMRETAAAYREDAKKIFKRIEDCALFTQDVRKTCEDVKRRMLEDSATN